MELRTWSLFLSTVGFYLVHDAIGQSASGNGLTPVPMLFIGFEQAAYTFSESQATTPQLCVTISGASDGVRAVVQITTSPETAQVGVDYVLNNAQLLITETSVRECFNIIITNDALPEGSETLQAQLSLQSIMVNESNEATVEFTLDQTNITIVDNIGFTDVPMSLTALLNSGAVLFTCASSPQFQAFNNDWLINGQLINTKIMPGVRVSNVNEESGARTSVLTLPTTLMYSGALVVCRFISEATTATSDPASLTLEFATVEFEMNNYTIHESVVSLMPYLLILDSNLPQLTNITVNVSTISGSASGGADFVFLVEKIILTDVSPGSRTLFSVTIINDTDVEREESFSLLLNPSSPGVLVNTSMATVTIVDDDFVVGVGFDPVVYNVSEGEAVMLRVILTATTDRTITLDLFTQSGTARAMLDYETVNRTLTFASRDELIVSVPVTSDEVTENVERFTVQLINARPPESTFYTSQVATVNIIDQQEALVQFSANEYTVSEGDPAALLVVQLLTPTERIITVTVTIEPGTAQSPVDYNISPETVTVQLDPESFQVFVAVHIVNDDVFDGTKVFYGTLSSQSERVSIPNNQTRVVIADTSVVFLWFNPVTYYISEDAGVVIMTIERRGANGIPVNVSIITVDLNATAGVNYEPLSQQLTFAPSLEEVSSMNFTVTIIDDDVISDTAKQFEVSLNTTQDGVLFGSDNHTATVNIIDNDRVPIEVGFQKTEYAVSESNGSLALIVIVEGNVSSSFDVNVIPMRGTATSTQDYELLQSTLTITPGISRYEIDVAIYNNLGIELRGYKNFSVSLSSMESSVVFTNRTSTITIYDNDFSPPIVTTTTSSDIAIDAEPFNFTCNVTTPLLGADITWIDSFGDVISNSTYARPGYSVASNTVRSSVLFVLMATSFSLSSYIQGAFSCVASIGNPFIEHMAIANAPAITGQLAAPSISINILPFSTRNITTGQNITIQCAITTNYGRVTDIEVIPHIFWDIAYENDGEVMRSSFEAQLTTLTPAVFLSTLEYTPILNTTNFTCRSSVEPLSVNNGTLVRQSATSVDTRIVSPQAPHLVVTIDPQPKIIIASTPPYNNYTLTCSVVIPQDLIQLQTSFSIYSSSPLSSLNFSANYTPAQDCGRIFSSRLCSYTVMTTEDSIIPEPSQRICSVELFVVNSETSERISVGRGETSVLVQVNFPGPPAPISNYHVYGVSNQLAIIHWIVSHIVYTPETYYIQYRTSIDEGRMSETLASYTVTGSRNISAENVEYEIVLDNLNSGTFYTANIVANNSFGHVVSPEISFATAPLNIYRVVSDMDDTIPLGAPLDITFRFNGEGITSISHSTQLEFYPLFHIPAIELSSIRFDRELQEINLGYSQVTTSLSGQYVLCQEAGLPPSARRKRGVDQSETRPRLCGGRVTLTVTVPTVTLSTNLLIEEYINGSYIGTGESPSVTCMPSDARAPVRWRSMFGVYGELPDDYQAFLSPPGLNHTLTFPSSYDDATPSRTDFFICDLINAELSNEAEVSPQTVTVRFIQAKVVILNDDKEVPQNGVINQFSTFGLNTEPGLSLRCLSVNGHSNLQWMSRGVPSLLPDGPISSMTSLHVDIDYFPEFDQQQRDVILTIRPISEVLTGYYSCSSQESGVSAEVYSTLTNPLWQRTTPTVNYLPIGSFLPVISVLYADFSVGYQNLGAGFSYSLAFESYTAQTQNSSNENDTLGRLFNNRSTLISGSTSNLIGNNVTYLITGQLSVFDGRYQLNATHSPSRETYSDTIDLIVVVPKFSQVDELVYSRVGDLVTLRCIPNDSMATVYWIRRLNGVNQEVISTSDSDFTLSPPQQNHQLTFNATNITMRILRDSTTTLRNETFIVVCGFINGEDSTNIISPMNLTVQLQEGQIEMVILPQEVMIRNNTVINRFTNPEGLGSGFAEGAPDPDFTSIGSLVVDCRAAQGDHFPVWTSDSLAINGEVTSNEGTNRQFIANYNSRLQLGTINSRTSGNYYCRSQESNIFTTFFISSENPYIRAVSPTKLVVTRGESATLIFLIATDSDGATWNNRDVRFHFTNRSGEQYPIISGFRDSRTDFPQYFVYTIPIVDLSDAGVYTASAPRRDCKPHTDACGFVSASIYMTVRTYCPEQVVDGILWPRSGSNSEVSKACDLAGSLFRQGTVTTRTCSETGDWSDVDLSTCTLIIDSPPFLLLSFVLGIEELRSVKDTSELEAEMDRLLQRYGVQFVDITVTLHSAYFASISVTFEVKLPLIINQEKVLNNFSGYFSTFFTRFGNHTVRRGNRSLTQVLPADSCPCQPLSGSVDEENTPGARNVIELCSGVSVSPCNCTLGSCQCTLPFVGDGVRCTLDSDGDLYPDVALQSPTCSELEGLPEFYCTQDNCPMVINSDQDPFACDAAVTNQLFTGCPYEVDDVWGITWPNAERNSTNIQLCPGGYDAVGNAMRFCNSNGHWEEANVLECTSIEFIGLEQLAVATIAMLDPEEQVMQSAKLTQQLVRATLPQNRSLLPNDLQASTRILTTVLEVLENNNNATADLNVIDIFDNMLDVSQMDGWRTLQMAGLMNGSELLLNNAERYGLLVASSANGSSSDQKAIRQSRQNIVVTGNQYREPPSAAIRFPIAADLVNFTKGSREFSEVNVPPSLVQERMAEMDENETLPVFFILVRDLPMGTFILNATTINATTCTAQGTLSTMAATDIVAAQVGMGNNRFGSSQTLRTNPVLLNFSFNNIERGSSYRCVFWNFSQPIGNGSWAITGVRTTKVTSLENQTSVQCTSSHLTSFAVLVDVAGGLGDLGDPERIALQVVSYIGCAVSIICLTATVIYFLLQGNKLKTSVHYFVHLNLAISLLLAFTAFVVGVETAIGSIGGCAFVAALLHYLFLSAFCWMLCEGIMLYLLLIVVFSEMSKKWWPFLIIGYVPPLPVVVITVGIRYQYYGVRDNCGELLYCWLSVERGTIFGFVAPMLAIILINVVFLIMALYTLFKTKRQQLKRKKDKEEETRETAKAILTALIVLLPLLGLTWMFGILTVNVNTTVFAWLFTIFNSLQGAFIFIFHVIRSDQVWSRISPKLQSLKRSTFKSSTRWYSVSSDRASTLRKGSSTLRSTNGTLSQEANSTLGRADTYRKIDMSFSATNCETSVHRPSTYELQSNLSSISETDEAGLEIETKVDLSLSVNAAASGDTLPSGHSLKCKANKENSAVTDSVAAETETPRLEKKEAVDITEKQPITTSEVISNPSAVNGSPAVKKTQLESELTKCDDMVVTDQKITIGE